MKRYQTHVGAPKPGWRLASPRPCTNLLEPWRRRATICAVTEPRRLLDLPLGKIAGVGSACAIAFGLVVAASCAEPEATTFGNPNALDRKNLPGDGGGAEPLVCTGDAGGQFDGGCPSFQTDIYPYFTAAGRFRCADGKCHGGTTKPLIDAGTPGSCLAALRAIKVGNIAYVPSDAGTKDPNATTLLCNLQGTCGRKMPDPPGADPTTADLCKIEAWLKCGAPNN